MRVSLLLVDSCEAYLIDLASKLRSHGYDVLQAKDAGAALWVLGSRSVDIVVMDVNLTGTSGLDLLIHMRTLGDNTIVLFLSEQNTVADRIAGLDAGADDYLVKPFAIGELISRIRALTRYLDKS